MPNPRDIDIGFAIGLPPREAIDYFKSKGYTISWNWFEVWQEANSTAFTVAKAMKVDVLQTLRDKVQEALETGITEKKFVKDLRPILQELGWWGRQEIDGEIVQLGSPWRLRNIYRTNLQTAYTRGRYKTQINNTKRRPYWQYVAVLDSVTRPVHRELNGKVFMHDDPFWNSHYPPNGWGCRCIVRSLSKRRLEANGLKIESSAGKLKDFQVRAGVIKATGEAIVADITGYEYEPGKFFKPDVGWSYNVGESGFTVNDKKLDTDLAGLL